MRRATIFCISLFFLWSASLLGQTAVTTRSTNLRRDPSAQHARIRLLQANEQLSLLSSRLRNGYYHVETADSAKGWVWARNVTIDTTTAPIPPSDSTAPAPIVIGPPVAGSGSIAGCGDALWHHVYHPYRLLVMNECVTVTGTIVDASNGRYQDGAKHEGDGDTHGWLRLDSRFSNLLNNGNMTIEHGNLVFEIVCHYNVTQTDAIPACSAFGDQTIIPPVGSHVAITGTFVQDTYHQRWNEIHPVSRIVVIP